MDASMDLFFLVLLAVLLLWAVSRESRPARAGHSCGPAFRPLRPPDFEGRPEVQGGARDEIGQPEKG